MVLTKEQRYAIHIKYLISPSGAKSYLEFRRRVYPMFGSDPGIVLPWCGMFLAIEADGYTHS